MPNTKSWKEYQDETNLFVAEPNVKATKSWRFLNDIPEGNKATILFFDALEEAKAKLYMALVRKDNQIYAKLYIVRPGHVNILYVDKNAVSQGMRVNRNLK